MQQFNFEELLDLGVVEGDGMVLSFIMFAVDRGPIHKLAVNMYFAVRAVEAAHPYLRMARLLGSRDRRQRLRGRALFRSLEGDDARFVVVDYRNFRGAIVLALQVDELRLLHLAVRRTFERDQVHIKNFVDLRFYIIIHGNRDRLEIFPIGKHQLARTLLEVSFFGGPWVTAFRRAVARRPLDLHRAGRGCSRDIQRDGAIALKQGVLRVDLALGIRKEGPGPVLLAARNLGQVFLERLWIGGILLDGLLADGAARGVHALHRSRRLGLLRRL
mmetsp:Transcript_16054/g.42341  ORF Transcript_16054/g.42341 Transcript_16054/m.42341 type:complete len:273 (-) Transcript_16054:1052-1870(-)